MTYYFAGPITFRDVDSPVLNFIIIMYFVGLLLAAVAVIIIAILIYKKRKRNLANTNVIAENSTNVNSGKIPPQTYSISNYLVGFFVDSVATAVPIATAGLLGVYNRVTVENPAGYWDNESFHRLAISFPITVLILRLIQRLVIKRTIGERLIKTPIVTAKEVRQITVGELVFLLLLSMSIYYAVSQ